MNRMFHQINDRCDRLERRTHELLGTDIRRAVRETLERTTNLPDHVVLRATDQLTAWIEQRIAAERHNAANA